ncbi:MAG: hypothetical protein WCJ41_07370 [Aestuariivirga sp.]|uniref:hypothetical protein n=1 Tax=Aestuariivirga sp. TaxID=2650926 RepID=UPI003019374A
MSLLDPILDLFRGKAVTIPPMDGALKPNTALDDGEVVAAALAPDNLAVLRGVPIYSSHREIRQLGYDHAVVGTCPADVSAIAVAEDGTLAVGLEDGSLKIGDRMVEGFNGITALAFQGNNLYVTNGSDHFRPSQWVSDLMHRNASGSVWEVDVKGGQRRKLAGGLAYANGVVVDAANNRLIVSESWRHRLSAVPLAGGNATEVLGRLPAYPGRITSAPRGYLLALFAPLNRLVEFVLQEPQYRADMMREIDSRFWIAPTLSPPHSFLEPLQNGGVRSMGVHKPWSPSRSYGLVATLDNALQPMTSYHSRANGRFHGVTSALAVDGAILATSKGGNHIISVQAGEGAS